MWVNYERGEMDKSQSVTSVSGGGIGLASILTIIFVIMKCLGYLSWSWLWVFAPLWIAASIAVGIVIIIGLVILVVYLVARHNGW